MEIVRLEMPFQPMVICALADTQFGGDAFWARGFREYVKMGVDAGAWWIGGGDYLDFASPSNRGELEAASLYDTARKTIWDAAEEQRREFMELLAPTKGRWLGLVHGHHYMRFSDGTTTDSRLAEDLGCRYLGTSGFVCLVFQRGGKSRGAVLVNLYVHHGATAGRKSGALVNRMEDLAGEHEADIYFVAHAHKRPNFPKDITVPETRGTHTPQIRHRTKLFVAMGSFMLGYVQGASVNGVIPEGFYPEKKQLPPVTLGGAAVVILPRHGEHGDYWQAAHADPLLLPFLRLT